MLLILAITILVLSTIVTMSVYAQQQQEQYSFVIQWGSEGSESGQFMGHNDVVPSPDGRYVYVPDYENHRIQKFTTNGTYVMEWGSGSESTTNGEFDNPHSVDVDLSGNVYVSDKDNHRIQKFTDNGTFIDTWGSEGTDDGQFTHLHGIAVDPHSGDVYATDTENFNVQKFDNNGTFITKWGSEGTSPGQFGSLESLDVDSLGDV